MTTVKILNVSPVNTNAGAQVEGSKKLQEENLEAASVFSALMNQQADMSNPVMSDEAEQYVVSKTEKPSTVAESYERYNYKENKIETVEEENEKEAAEEAADELQQFEEDVVDAISEEYNVDEETILSTLEEMGLGVFDLLNPQNLANFVMELTGLSSTEEVLFDSSFLNIMEILNNLKADLMKELGITSKEFDNLVAQMEAITSNANETTGFQEELEVEIDNLQNAQDEAIAENAAGNVTEGENQITDEAVSTAAVAENAEISEEDENSAKVNVEVEKQSDVAEQKEVSSTENNAGTTSNGDESTPFGNTNSSENLVMNSNVANDANMEASKVQTSAYTSVDAMQLLEQIAERVRVYANTDTTTMEMQLNPENLGKIYLHISSEEGVVNAQFTAVNEAVKEALEAQMSTLRENLAQAGVKVDAIEVTIASHEFEQNLEQNHRQAEEELENAEEIIGRRRNLRMDSLDELSGLMTEEEALVAQIMKENGNSVDLTA